MKRPHSSGVAALGVGHVGKITAQANCIFQNIAQENDIGIDAIIEFIVDEAATGCCIGVQIKSGASYIENERFIVRSDAQHKAYWRSHVLPIAGIVYDPDTDSARWADITEYLDNDTAPNNSCSITADHIFDLHTFSTFREHFLTYRDRYSDDRNFARSLLALSRIHDSTECRVGIRSLFNFHRNKPEAWFFLLSTLRYFRESPLLKMLVVTLCHVPGHPDILWGKRNIISDETTRIAEELFRRLLSRDDALTLISAIDDEVGIGRGSVGQCVDAIIGLIRERNTVLESIASDISVRESHRFWAALLLISYLQYRDITRCAKVIQRIIPTFPEEEAEKLTGLLEVLKRGEVIDFC